MTLWQTLLIFLELMFETEGEGDELECSKI